jgi:hypothetical protein
MTEGEVVAVVAIEDSPSVASARDFQFSGASEVWSGI